MSWVLGKLGGFMKQQKDLVFPSGSLLSTYDEYVKNPS